MKLLYFRRSGALRLGLETERGVFDVDAALAGRGEAPLSGRNLTRDDLDKLRGLLAQPDASAYCLATGSFAIATCTPHASKIICIGLNYRKHAAESNMPVPATPVVFTKYANTLVDFGAPVTLGEVGREFDYEVELGVVIGRRAKKVPAANALDYVLGYCTANDLSCRDLQFRTSQWLMGKSLDGFLPLGAHIVSFDEIPDPQALALETHVNGQLRQSSNTADMVFSVAAIIEDLSRHFTLEPGDLILTGTPEGVAMGLPDKPWLKPGDLVETSIEKIGSTVNLMC